MLSRTWGYQHECLLKWVELELYPLIGAWMPSVGITLLRCSHEAVSGSREYLVYMAEWKWNMRQVEMSYVGLWKVHFAPRDPISKKPLEVKAHYRKKNNNPLLLQWGLFSFFNLYFSIFLYFYYIYLLGYIYIPAISMLFRFPFLFIKLNYNTFLSPKDAATALHLRIGPYVWAYLPWGPVERVVHDNKVNANECPGRWECNAAFIRWRVIIDGKLLNFFYFD